MVWPRDQARARRLSWGRRRKDEMHRRFAAIAREQEVELDRLGNIHILCLAGKDAVLASANVRDIVEPTQLWSALRRSSWSSTKACSVRHAGRPVRRQ